MTDVVAAVACIAMLAITWLAVRTAIRLMFGRPVEDGRPDGCLGCNPRAVRRALVAAGADPSIFHEVPPSRHRWSDIVPCDKCGRQWLVLPHDRRAP